jgi:hypothetical protein
VWRVDVWITHIGYPGNTTHIKGEMASNPPKLFICGHSHILKVMFDKKHDLLHMNSSLRQKRFSSSANYVAFRDRWGQRTWRLLR